MGIDRPVSFLVSLVLIRDRGDTALRARNSGVNYPAISLRVLRNCSSSHSVIYSHRAEVMSKKATVNCRMTDIGSKVPPGANEIAADIALRSGPTRTEGA